jgi:hypothetical protein
MPTFLIKFSSNWSQRALPSIIGHNEFYLTQYGGPQFHKLVVDGECPSLSELQQRTNIFSSIVQEEEDPWHNYNNSSENDDDMSDWDSNYSSEEDDMPEVDSLGEDDIKNMSMTLTTDGRLPTTKEEYEGQGVYINNKKETLGNPDTVMRVSYEGSWNTQGLEIKGSRGRHLLPHPDVELYLHPEDVCTEDEHGRLYDHEFKLIGKVNLKDMTYPVNMPTPTSKYIEPIYTTGSSFMDVYSNPHTYKICRIIAPCTRIVISDHLLGGKNRRLVYMEKRVDKKDKKWLSIGWVATDAVFKDNKPDNTMVKGVTLDRHLHNKLLTETNRVDRQHDLNQVLEMCHTGALFPSPITAVWFRKCKAADDYTLRRVETISQPIPITIQNEINMTVQQLLNQYMNGDYNKFSGESLLDNCSADGKGKGEGSERSAYIKKTESEDCIILNVLRRDMTDTFGRPNGARVDDIPVIPSEHIMHFGVKYNLVSFATKTGTSSSGHWTSVVKTVDDNNNVHWYEWSDAECTRVDRISKKTSGVMFVYQKECYPLFQIEESEGLYNNGYKCWANAFCQMMRYSSYVGESIGVKDRMPTFQELMALLDTTENIKL